MDNRQEPNQQTSLSGSPAASHQPAAQEAGSATTDGRSGCRRWAGLIIVFSILLSLGAFLLWLQIQTGRVLTSGVPANAAVMSVKPCSGEALSNVKLTYTDASGKSHTVNHTSPTGMPCDNTGYQAGDTVPIRYIPDNPELLMTQDELNNLPRAIIFHGLGDILVFGTLGFALYANFIRPQIARRRAVARVS